MAPDNETTVGLISSHLHEAHQAGIKTGAGWSAATQGGYQMLALLVTILFSLVGGIVAGLFDPSM